MCVCVYHLGNRFSRAATDTWSSLSWQSAQVRGASCLKVQGKPVGVGCLLSPVPMCSQLPGGKRNDGGGGEEKGMDKIQEKVHYRIGPLILTWTKTFPKKAVYTSQESG